MDRAETVDAFRRRLEELIDRSGVTRTAFAARAGIDRSTLAQLLSSKNQRLPRAETIVAIARNEQVSTDWLLGVGQAKARGSDVQSLEIARGAASPADERLRRWHVEAAGYKIRTVPTTVPDLLKTEAVIRLESSHEVAERWLQLASDRLAYSRAPETDMEVCSSWQQLRSLALGQDVWSTLSLADRRAQLEHMRDLVEEMYPTFRWFLYDGCERFSVPLTIFGPRRAAVYVGDMYFVFNSTEHIRVLTRHFDDLIRAAVVQPVDIAAWLTRALEELPRR